MLIILPPSRCSDLSAVAISPGPGQFAGRRRGQGTRQGLAGDQRPPGDPTDDVEKETDQSYLAPAQPETHDGGPPGIGLEKPIAGRRMPGKVVPDSRQAAL